VILLDTPFFGKRGMAAQREEHEQSKKKIWKRGGEGKVNEHWR
jgi:hypothetical protein